MKAIVVTKNGPPEVLQLKEVAKPVPADNEVLIKIHAATVTAGDVMMRKLSPLLALPMRLLGLRAKKIPGHELAGEIEAVGKNVKRFKVGERVFGTTTGLSSGANAEYICLPEDRKMSVLEKIPAEVSYEEAAAVPVGGMTALYLLKKGDVQKGQKVLVYGASGSVGTYALQLAKYYDAEVTGVCSTSNIDLVKSLGADHVIDYKKEDLSQNGQTYDIVFDAVGKLPSDMKKSLLKENGRIVSVAGMTKEESENLLLLAELLETGKLKAVIDKRYPLEQTAEAHRYVETGHKKGNLIITVSQE